ncbi:MAG: glycoside hydrolase family 95 protein [Pedobacter sp.]|nr:MAG: glycoside hydrolase family 95 protein [Pedobacter sp.]
MISLSRLFKVFAIVGICITSIEVSAQSRNVLWYNKPAEKWTDALPIGNGRLGMMIFGGVATDHLQFNEETLWSGKPRNYNRADAGTYLPQIRQLLTEGKQKEAEVLAQEKFMGLQSEAGDRKLWVDKIKSGKGISGNPALSTYDDRDWKMLQVPAYDGWETVGLANLDGAVWFRTTFNLPESWKGKDLLLDLNRIRDFDNTYINGTLVGSTDGTDARKYNIPASQLKTGENTIAIQVLNYYDKGGIVGYKDTNRKIGIYPVGAKIEDGISLVKHWKYKIQDNDPPVVAQFQASYQPFGDLKLYFKNHAGSFSNYKRSLDLNTAVASTSYTLAGVNYKREYFASAINQAVVMRFTADKANVLSFDAELSSPHLNSPVQNIDKNTISLKVSVKGGALNGESYLTAVVKSGSVSLIGNKLRVLNASDVTLYLSAATNFKTVDDLSGNPASLNKAIQLGYKNQSYETLKKKHISDYKSLFTTFDVDFGSSVNESLPTDERLAKFAKSIDPAFIALYMQYGRYLLISSSRAGTQPANLQGIWNDLLSPPWGSKYTTNINLEMNYWPTEILNLPTLNEPLFNKIKGLSKKGAETARTYYNARGWVLHHNTDLWNGAAPINASNHGIWVTGGAWLSEHLWEHYLYSKDQTFLAKEAYPLMKQAALFFVDFLVKDPKTGWLISTPSNSPENGGLVAGPTMDHQLIRSLFKNCIAASQILGIDAETRNVWEEKLKNIAPNQIGKHGQLQEWLTDIDDTTNKHRHVSHLWGVYPGNDISWAEQPQLMEAAKQSLLYRGDDATGWSLAWKINFWARFKDGDHAMELIKMLLKPTKDGSSGSYTNLFDAHPPFQIDGNFGAAAGVGELIIQSHERFIEILPALPSAIPYGEIKGIRARGAFEFDVKWDKGQLKELIMRSKTGGECNLKYGDKNIKLATQAGKTYKFNAELRLL